MNNPLTSASQPDANKKLEREIDRLAARIQKFRVDSQRFFAGDLALPPDEMREKITAELRRLRGSGLKGAAASFRLGSLEAQFQSHLDLFGRRLKAREQGAASAAARADTAATPDPEKGVILGKKDSAAAVETLFKGLYQRNPQMDLERFRAYIHRQAETIRAKTGCSEIQFRIAVQDGKTKLKAKPVRGSSPSSSRT